MQMCFGGPTSGTHTVETYKTTAVVFSELSHQCCITHRIDGQTPPTAKLHGETDSMDANPAIACTVSTVKAFNGINNILDGAAGKVVTKNIKADFFVLGVEAPNGCFNTFDRAGIGKGKPAG